MPRRKIDPGQKTETLSVRVRRDGVSNRRRVVRP